MKKEVNVSASFIQDRDIVDVFQTTQKGKFYMPSAVVNDNYVLFLSASDSTKVRNIKEEEKGKDSWTNKPTRSSTSNSTRSSRYFPNHTVTIRMLLSRKICLAGFRKPGKLHRTETEYCHRKEQTGRIEKIRPQQAGLGRGCLRSLQPCR